MSVNIKLKKGFDINLAGKAEKNVVQVPMSDTYALKPEEFIGFVKPKLLVKEGDKVKAGQALYFDKSLESIKFASPVSGEIVEIRRGEKRRLLEIVVKADGSQAYVQNKTYSASEISNLSVEETKKAMLEGGVWPCLIQRPFSVIANPEDAPKAIFISGFDSAPLAPDYSVVLKGEEENFKIGIEVLKKLTEGTVHLNLSADAEVTNAYSGANGIQLNKISGPHPAGNVGVQIHHIAPINKGEIVWTLNPQSVVVIGRLFNKGIYDVTKVVAVAGSEVKNPQYYKVIGGVKVSDLVANNLKSDHVRCISGNVLSGTKVSQEGYLGFYDNLLTVIPEGDQLRFFGSFLPSTDRVSFHRSLGLFSFLNKFINPTKEYEVDTNINGEHRAFVQTGVFEQVLPMDIYPTHLLKAILTEDFEEMEALGIYEVAEEDFALCEFVDVSKNDIQSIIRTGLDLMKNS